MGRLQRPSEPRQRRRGLGGGCRRRRGALAGRPAWRRRAGRPAGRRAGRRRTRTRCRSGRGPSPASGWSACRPPPRASASAAACRSTARWGSAWWWRAPQGPAGARARRGRADQRPGLRVAAPAASARRRDERGARGMPTATRGALEELQRLTLWAAGTEHGANALPGRAPAQRPSELADESIPPATTPSRNGPAGERRRSGMCLQQRSVQRPLLPRSCGGAGARERSCGKGAVEPSLPPASCRSRVLCGAAGRARAGALPAGLCRLPHTRGRRPRPPHRGPRATRNCKSRPYTQPLQHSVLHSHSARGPAPRWPRATCSKNRPRRGRSTPRPSPSSPHAPTLRRRPRACCTCCTSHAPPPLAARPPCSTDGTAQR